jgi:hypothetical protein
VKRILVERSQEQNKEKSQKKKRESKWLKPQVQTGQSTSKVRMAGKKKRNPKWKPNLRCQMRREH